MLRRSSTRRTPGYETFRAELTTFWS